MSMPPTKPTTPVCESAPGDVADEERTLVLLEHDRADVRALAHVVDQHEEGVGVLRRDGGDGVGLQEAGRDDELGALPRRSGACPSGGVGRALELEQVDLEAFGGFEVGDGALHAAEGAFVERAVELAAGVEGDAEDVVLGAPRPQGGGDQRDEAVRMNPPGVVGAGVAGPRPRPAGYQARGRASRCRTGGRLNGR
jgi:hypothetical protein